VVLPLVCTLGTVSPQAVGIVVVTALGMIQVVVTIVAAAVTSLVFATAKAPWTLSRASRLVAKAPTATVIACVAGMLVLASPWGGARFAAALTYGEIARGAVFLVLFGGFLCAAPALFDTYPRTMTAFRTHIETRWPERWLASRLRNPLDAWFIRLVMYESLLTLPGFVAVFVPGWFNPYTVTLYIGGLISVQMFHEILDHTNIHNNLFAHTHLKNRFDRGVVGFLGFYQEFILNPLCGRIPHGYRVQHVYVHHVENNGQLDNQSTLKLDLTSCFDFARHCFRMSWSSAFPIDVAAYLIERRRHRPLRALLVGHGVYYAALVGLAFLCWPAALGIFVMRYIDTIGSVFLAFLWHGFIDEADPKNLFRNTLNIHNTEDEHGFFGTNFHLEHHLKPSRHWSLLGADAETNRTLHHDEHVITLRDIGPPSFVKAAWTGNFRRIAELCIEPQLESGEDPNARLDRLASLLEERARRHRRPYSPAWQAIDQRVTHLLGSVMPP